MAPGRPVCLVDFDLQKGDFRALLDTPHRRSVADLVVVVQRDLRPPPAGDPVHAQGRLPAAARARGGREGRGRRLRGRAQRAQRGQGAPRADRGRHRRGRDRGDRDRGRDGRPGAGRHARPTCSRCAACGGCATSGSGSACARTRTSGLLNRASRRREIQPDLARKVVGETMVQTTIPADFNALEAAVNTGSPSRLEDNKLRGAFEALATELEIVPEAEPLGPPRRRAARPARPPRRRARPVDGRVHGPVPGARDRLPRPLADRAHRLHVRHRRPRGPRGRARARDRPDLAQDRREVARGAQARLGQGARLPQGRARGPHRRLAQARRDPSCAATSRSPCGCASRCCSRASSRR